MAVPLRVGQAWEVAMKWRVRNGWVIALCAALLGLAIVLVLSGITIVNAFNALPF